MAFAELTLRQSANSIILLNSTEPPPTMPDDHSIHPLQIALNSLQSRSMTISAFCQTWRAQSGLLAQLPPRYGQVMEDLLGRLEAGSLFSEESCSFSQEDLHANLALWLDKVQQALGARN
jgi:hypothetical protein